jgi:hypothetical protein
MRATVVGLLAFWLPWSVVAFVATLALARGTLGTLDSTRYGLLTMGVYLRGIAALFTKRVATFKVTPKDGIDAGGVAVLRTEGLLVVVTLALAATWTARVLEVAGVLALPSLPAFATVVVLALGVWELYCIGRTLLPLVRRRQLRTGHRTQVEMQARIAGTSAIVDVTDVSSRGLGVEALPGIAIGTSLDLLTRIPDSSGALHDVTLPVQVVSLRRGRTTGLVHMGCRFTSHDEATRERLVEFCDVVLPRRRLTRAATELPLASAPPPTAPAAAEEPPSAAPASA